MLHYLSASSTRLPTHEKYGWRNDRRTLQTFPHLVPESSFRNPQTGIPFEMQILSASAYDINGVIIRSNAVVQTSSESLYTKLVMLIALVLLILLPRPSALSELLMPFIKLLHSAFSFPLPISVL